MEERGRERHGAGELWEAPEITEPRSLSAVGWPEVTAHHWEPSPTCAGHRTALLSDSLPIGKPFPYFFLTPPPTCTARFCSPAFCHQFPGAQTHTSFLPSSLHPPKAKHRASLLQNRSSFEPHMETDERTAPKST